MWADAEAMARAYLLDALPAHGLDGVPVSTTVPKPRPARFVRLMSSGSERLTLVHRETRITAEVWNAAGVAEAARDAEAVYMALDGWDLVPPFDGWPSGPYPQPDPTTGTPRYVMTCAVRHRMED